MEFIKKKVYERPEIMAVDVQCGNMLLATSNTKNSYTIKFKNSGTGATGGLQYAEGDPDDID